MLEIIEMLPLKVYVGDSWAVGCVGIYRGLIRLIRCRLYRYMCRIYDIGIYEMKPV